MRVGQLAGARCYESQDCLPSILPKSTASSPKPNMPTSKLASKLALLLAFPVTVLLAADTPAGFTRKVLQDRDLAIPTHHSVVAQVDFAKDGAVGRHTHPGEEVGYVIEGTVVIEIDGQPAQTLKAGETFFIPAGAIHAAKNVTGGPARLVATYVVEKGKPLATPVAAK